MQVMRLFVAVPADESLRWSLIAIQQELQREVGEAFRWEPADHLHLTLKFLGDVPVDGIQEVFGAVRSVAAAWGTTVLTPRDLEAFPRPERPRVLVLTLDDASGVVTGIAKALEDAFAELGFPREARAFRPHITLGRARRGGRTPAVTGSLARVDLSAARELYVDALTVYQSKLSSSGAEYTVLTEEPLGAPLEEADEPV